MAANDPLKPNQVAVTEDVVLAEVARIAAVEDVKLPETDALKALLREFAIEMFGSLRTIPVGYVEDFAEDFVYQIH